MSKSTVVYEITFPFTPDLPEHNQIKTAIANPTFKGLDQHNLCSSSIISETTYKNISLK
jgi:hypothetical protein